MLKPYRKVIDSNGDPVHYYDIFAKKGTANLVAGLPTPILGYTGDGAGTGQVPGPLIKVDQGTKVVVTMHNQLPATHPTFGTPIEISTHLHGSASLPQYDGYASDVTASGLK